MIHSLQLESSQVSDIYKSLKSKIDLIRLKEAYLSANHSVESVAIEDLTERTIDDHFEFISSFTDQPEHTCLLFNILTYISEKKILSSADIQNILDSHINSRGNRIGKLNINEDSILCVSWNLSHIINSEIFWIPKVNYQLNEIVPEPLVQLLNSSFLCLEKGFNLSALSLALLALETALWDHLSARGISRTITYERYPNKVIGKLEWDGSSYKIDLFDKSRTPKNPTTAGMVDFEILRSSKNHKDEGKCYLEISIRETHADWLSDSSEKEIITKDHAGLSVALERARRENLIWLWERPLDETFRILRNALAHHPSNPEEIRICTPFGEFPLDKFSVEPNLVVFFIKRITEYISEAYFDCGIAIL